MCGYVGFTNKISNSNEVLSNMMNAIKHRGPDDEGRYIDQNIALGFRRLSIVDLESSHQPILSEDDRLVLTMNGEIYNFKELRAELISLGHNFKTNGDAEVVLHGYEQFGSGVVNHLRGMFSFVIYDKQKNQIFGARDMFGIKPLYYAIMEDSFMFGSEIKAFLHHPRFKKELNKKVLAHYLSFQYSPLKETFFKNVLKLEAGHYFIFKDGNISVERYFEPKFEPQEKSLEEAANKTEEVIANSVEAHKVSDVEIGSFLSSGIDSSYIASTAKVKKTFTVGFEGKKYNEIDYAKEFAKSINAEHYSRIISADEYFDNFSNIQYYMDEPLADPAAIALYFVSKLASEQVKAVFSGEGADELFGGYNVYKEPFTAPAYNKIPFVVRRAIGAVASLFPKVRGFNFLIRRGKKVNEWFIGGANIFSLRERNAILNKDIRAAAPQLVTKKYYLKSRDYDTATRMQYLDINMWLAGDILLKADKTSMANSLELRVPFLDKEVAKLALSLPTNCRVDAKTSKKALRAAARKSILEFTANKDKLGFPVPIRVWLREEKYYNKVKEAFLSEEAKQFFKPKKLVKMLKIHKKGKKDLSRKIWAVYTFLMWYDEFFVKR